MNSYGSCQLFTSHRLVNFAINQTFLRSHESLHDEINDDDNDLDIDTDYFTEGTICAVPSDKESPDPFYFVKIEGEAIAKFDMMDDYNNLIKIDQHYILGHYLEKESCSPKGGLSYSVYTKKTVYFYKESIIYPFVPLHEKQKGKKSTLFISNNEYCDIIHFVEETNMARL